MRLLFAAAGCALMLVVAAGGAQARPDLVELYAEAVRTADAAALERLLAPNYWHISSNGHIQDKEHFIAAIKTGKLAVKTLRIRNVRASMAGKTLVAAATNEKDFGGYGGNVEAAKKLGGIIAERALKAGIENVVFDRGGYLYHGRVKALADGAREGGLKF